MKTKLATILGLLALSTAAFATPVDTSTAFDDATAQHSEVLANAIPWVTAVALGYLVIRLIRKYVK